MDNGVSKLRERLAVVEKDISAFQRYCIAGEDIGTRTFTDIGSPFFNTTAGWNFMNVVKLSN